MKLLSKLSLGALLIGTAAYLLSKRKRSSQLPESCEVRVARITTKAEDYARAMRDLPRSSCGVASL